MLKKSLRVSFRQGRTRVRRNGRCTVTLPSYTIHCSCGCGSRLTINIDSGPDVPDNLATLEFGNVIATREAWREFILPLLEDTNAN